MIGYFIFDDIDTRNYEGIIVSEDKVDSAPARVYEEIEIPGKNGTLLIDGKRYENVSRSYDILVHEDYVSNLISLRNDLLSKVGYKVLMDGFNPDEKCMAAITTPIEPQQLTWRRTAGSINIVFNRKPQRFLLEGDEPLDLYDHDYLTDHNLEPLETETGAYIDVDSMSGSFTNPTNFESRPLIIAPRPGSVVIGNQTITVGGDGSSDIYIDCDSMEIYKINASGALINAAELVSFVPNEIPSIKTGENTLRSTIPDVQIIPRWWIL